MIFLGAFIFVFMHMTAFWFLYRLLKNPSIVDVGWASVLTLTGWVFLLFGNHAVISLICGALLLIWGLRLGGYLWFSRVGKGHLDKRYTKLSEGWKMAKDLGFFLNFQLQGILAFIIALSFYFISKRTGMVGWDGLGIMMIVVGLIGESAADYQLQAYKRNAKEAVCQNGLWRYCRHPNYFFDWLSWLGFSLIAIQAPNGWIAFVSPLTLYIIMVYITGPMTEAGSLSSRGEAYRTYQRQTNQFFPGPRKKVKNDNFQA
ncbi:DUF1295 domain-containing protein [Legionella sp. W05-934-2]|jgi:steroid 5-alpha reductase family enzyme|uniref:DUF1295 domain-containing protein n=1 Tax=Legionella sp. W05-934-2 TaxID=1198649 RepID=UPI0034626512